MTRFTRPTEVPAPGDSSPPSDCHTPQPGALPNVLNAIARVEPMLSGTSKEVPAQQGRLQGLVVDAARAGALSNPFTEIRRPRGLRTLHLEALWWLRAEGLLSVNQITRRVGTSVSKTTRLVDRLEERGLVWRDRWEDDRRVVRVHLTDEGRELAAQADQAIQQRVGSLLLPLDPTERETFLTLLERIVDAQRTRAARQQ